VYGRATIRLALADTVSDLLSTPRHHEPQEPWNLLRWTVPDEAQEPGRGLQDVGLTQPRIGMQQGDDHLVVCLGNASLEGGATLDEAHAIALIFDMH
jgi:hypothetical protein